MGSFKDVIGHKNIIGYIKNAVQENKVSHAYILNGARGSGKKMLAALFAETLLCEAKGPEPCNKCHSCRQVDSGNHPDLVQIGPVSMESIGVDIIRTKVNSDIMIKPYQGPYKIYIIDHADLMTEEAQNALLKTVEEPPEYAVIFLLTENWEKLLPTITSRCVMLKLRNIKDTLIKKYLMEKLEVPDYKAEMCTAFAQGNIGRAILLAKSERFNEIREESVHLLKNIREMELNELTEAIRHIHAYKLEAEDYFDIIMIWYRDVLMYKATKEVDKIVFKELIPEIKERAKKSSYEGVELVLDSLDKAKARLRANVNFALVMELLFLTIKEN